MDEKTKVLYKITMMKSTPINQIVHFTEENLTLWKRGSASLSPQKTWIPRLLHATWHQDVTRSVRRSEHTHNVYHICKVEEGAGSMLLHGRTVPTRPGSFILVSPGEPHAFELAPTEKESYSEATFEVLDEKGRAVCCPIHTLLAGWTGLPCRPWSAGAMVSPALQRSLSGSIAALVLAVLEPSARRAFAVNRALLNLLEIVALSLGGVSAGENDPLQAAADEIERNLQNTLAIRTLAQGAGMSTNHFIRSFRNRFGVTPLAFHQEIRINTARRLLSQTHYSIKCIADWTGFSDVYYFSRLFARRTGMPPGAYRRTHSPTGEPFKPE